MEKRCPRGETAQNRSLDFADMVEFAVNQCLAEIGGGLAVACRQTLRIRFTHCDTRQITHIKTSEIHRRVRRVRVTSTDVQGRRERVIPYIRRIVAGAAGSLKRGNAVLDQAPCRKRVVYTPYSGDIYGFGIENRLPARNRCPRIRVR